jgi:hypothetical protein
LTIAGLWDEWKNRETGERIKFCTTIIDEPNEFVAEVHDRMPVLLKPEQFDHWLSGNMGVEELKPASNDYLQRWAVSKRINSSKPDKDDATLIEPGESSRLTRPLAMSMIGPLNIRYRPYRCTAANRRFVPLADIRLPPGFALHSLARRLAIPIKSSRCNLYPTRRPDASY